MDKPELFYHDRATIAEALARHAPDVPVVDVAETDTGAMDRVVAEATSLAQPGDADLTKHLTDNSKEKEEEKAKATEKAVQQYNFTPAPRPKDVDEKLLRPEPGQVVSKHDYELNQAVAFLKSRLVAQAN